MKTFVGLVAAVVMLVFVLLLSGCSSGSVVSTLTLVVDAAEIALPIVAGPSGASPAEVAIAEKYLQDVDAAIVASGPILSSAATAAVKAAQIVQLFSGLAMADLPVGTPQVIITAVNKVSAAVVQFLTNFTTKLSVKAGAQEVRVSARDRVALERLAARAKVNLDKIKAAKK